MSFKKCIVKDYIDIRLNLIGIHNMYLRIWERKNCRPTTNYEIVEYIRTAYKKNQAFILF
jgi:hypothetical protein